MKSEDGVLRGHIVKAASGTFSCSGVQDGLEMIERGSNSSSEEAAALKSLLAGVLSPRLRKILIASLLYCFSGFCLYFFFVPSIFCSGNSSSLHLRTFQGMNECDALRRYHLFHKDFSDSFSW